MDYCSSSICDVVHGDFWLANLQVLSLEPADAN